MNVLLFGATGMVGDGVLHECLTNSEVDKIIAVVRSPLSLAHPKLSVVSHRNFYDYSDLTKVMAATDACFFCLGVSSIGMSEEDYSRQTFDLTLAAGRSLAVIRPGAAFCYVSGEGTDSSEKGRSMWARVKGRTENALLALPLKAYMFRPGFIRLRPGVQIRSRRARIAYRAIAPLYPLLKRLAPNHVTTVESIARAMIEISARGNSSNILHNAEINRSGELAASR